MFSKIWTFFNSQIFLLILGFILTGIVGHYLTSKYQEKSWERDRKYEVFKQEIEEAKKTLEEVNLHISSRTYSLQKVHWELESHDLQGAKREYKKYIEVKDDWNKKIRIYRNKMKRLVDYDLAFLLLDSENSVNVPKKASVHAYFANAHAKSRTWLRCLESNCSELKSNGISAHQSLKELFQASDHFIDESYAVFLKKYKGLQVSPSVSALTNGSSATAKAAP